MQAAPPRAPTIKRNRIFKVKVAVLRGLLDLPDCWGLVAPDGSASRSRTHLLRVDATFRKAPPSCARFLSGGCSARVVAF
jgi:hypothetical protein